MIREIWYSIKRSIKRLSHGEVGTWVGAGIAGGAAIGVAGGLLGRGGSAPSIMEDTAYNQMQANGQGGNFNSLTNENSTYLADMFSQLGTGQAPSYYQKYQSQAMPYYQNMLNQQYFGTPGNRMGNSAGGPSGIGNAMTMASMFGMNPKATSGMVNKNQLAYNNANSQLDQYFASQGLNTIQNVAGNLPGWATGQQQALTGAFEPHFSNAIPGVAGTNPLAPLASAVGQYAGYMAGGGGSPGGYGSSGGLPSGSMTPSMMAPTSGSGMMDGMMATVGGGSPV